MFVIAGTAKGATALVFSNRADLDCVIKNLEQLRKNETFIDKPLAYAFYPGEIEADEMDNSYRKLMEMVESKPWESGEESG